MSPVSTAPHHRRCRVLRRESSERVHNISHFPIEALRARASVIYVCIKMPCNAGKCRARASNRNIARHIIEGKMYKIWR